jgi:lysophospholipase L1-like esterase
MTRPDPTDGLSWKKKLGFSLFALVLIVGVLEVAAVYYLRWTRGYDGEHLLQYEYDAYKNILPTKGYRDLRGVQHNSAGFRRSEDVTVDKPAGTYRVFLMGASTAYGLGGLWPHIQREYAVLDNSETIDAYLEQQLQVRFPGVRIEVINAAITSTWTHHHLIYLNQSVLRYHPDMVLFLDGFNDFFFYEPWHDQFSRYSYSEHSRVVMGPPTLKALAAANGWWLFRKSAFAHAVFRAARDVKTALTPRRADDPLEVDAALNSLRSVFAKNALKMIERTSLILAHEGVTSVHMMQPLLILERERAQMPDVERRLFDFNVSAVLQNYEEFMHRAVPMLAAMQEASHERLGSTFIDLTGIYKGVEGQMFTDYAHLTPRGNQILASHVVDRIDPLIRRDLRMPASGLEQRLQ